MRFRRLYEARGESSFPDTFRYPGPGIRKGCHYMSVGYPIPYEAMRLHNLSRRSSTLSSPQSILPEMLSPIPGDVILEGSYIECYLGESHQWWKCPGRSGLPGGILPD